MSYGQNRNSVATDTFDSSIDGSWDNGWSNNAQFEWVSGGVIQGTVASSMNGARRNTGTYADDQYSRGTISTFTNATSIPCASVRHASGASDESCYMASATNYGGTIYEIYEMAVTTGATSLANVSGLSTTTPIILTCEAEGTTLRCGSSENGGADTERLNTTDATWASGRPGLILYIEGTLSGTRYTSWEGGSISVVAGGPSANSRSLMGVGL